MAKTYKKNFKNVYKLPLYSKLEFWILVAIVVAVALTLIARFFDNSIIQNLKIFSYVSVATLTTVRAYSLVKRVIRAKTVKNFILETSSERAITKNLLSTMTVNRLQDTPFISVPNVDVSFCASKTKRINVKIEKLAGMYEVERLTEDINSSFRGKLSNFAVTSSIVTTDGLTYNFILEDVATDKTFCPRKIEDLKAEKYKIKLQNDLIIDLSERAHIAIWGKTGSKKTTVLFGMILQFLTMNADLYFLDGKREFSAFETFYQSEKIGSTVDDVLNLLDVVLKIVDERQTIMKNESQKREKIGLKASDVGLRPVVLIADEIGSIVAQMDNKQSKKFVNGLVAIIQRGRSVGVSIIASTQDPGVDTLPSKIRQQFSTRILLGSSNGDTQRMAFGEVATAGDVEDFQGFYISDGLTNQPLKFFVNDLYSYNFNDLRAFKECYKIGQKVEYD